LARTAMCSASAPHYKRQAQYKLNIKLSRDTSDRAVVGGLQGVNRTKVGITVDKFSFCAKSLMPPALPPSST